MPPPTSFQVAVGTLGLTETQKHVLNERYVPLIAHLEMRTRRISLLFHSSRVIVTVGSLIVPALLSIQYSQGTGTLEGVNLHIYWSAWIISLFVTICNGLLTLFKLDKRYYFLHTILEQLISEGWQYIELSGRFSGFYTPGVAPTHDNQFVFFCHAVEKLRMRQIQEEYYKLTEPTSASVHPVGAVSQPTGQLPQISIDTLIPPTPLRLDLTKLPKELLDAILRGQQGQQSQPQQQSNPPIGDHNGGKDAQENQENRAGGAMPVHGQLSKEGP